MQPDQTTPRFRISPGQLTYVLVVSAAIYWGAIEYGGGLVDRLPSPWNGMVQTVAVVVSVAVAGWVLAWWEWRREGERQDAA